MRRTGKVLVQPPREGDNTTEQNDRTERNEPRVQWGQASHLVEVDEAVEDGGDVVDAEDERIKDARRAKLEATVKIVELSEGKDDKAKEDEPRLVMGKLVSRGKGGDEKLDSRFGEEKGVSGKNPGDAAIAHASHEFHTRAPRSICADVSCPAVAANDCRAGV